MVDHFKSDGHACWTKKKRRTSISNDEPQHSRSTRAAFYNRLSTMTTVFEEDLNYAIGWNRLSLQILGVWPEWKDNASDPTLSKYWFILHSFFMLGFVTLPQSAYLLMIWGDVDLTTEILATGIVPVSMSCIKLLFARYYLESLRPLLSSFVEDWKRSKSEDERSVMLVNAKKARIISIWCTTLAHFMTSILILPRSLMIAQMQRDQFDPPSTVVYPAYFPYDISGTSTFLISCFGQIVAAYSATVSYVGVDTFITMLVLHACAQITNLRHALENLSNGTSEIANEFTTKLTWIVKRHEHLNWYTKSIENSFNILMLIQILACIIQVCFQAFQLVRIMEHDGSDFPIERLAFIVLFLIVILVQLYLYCYIGEMLIVESSAMGTSVYESQWCTLSPKDARNIIFVMHRSSIPFRLTAGKFGTFSMEMFSSILKTTIGYLSVLLTVTEKND